MDEHRRFYYSFGWKLLQEDIDDDLDGALDRRAQTFWGLRSGDDVIMRRHDTNLDGVYEDSYYHLTDDQFSTIALIDASGILVERISYDPYGEARHHRRADLDGDGAVTSADRSILTANLGNYGVGDLNRDGVVDSADATILFDDRGGALPAGQLSTPGSSGVDNHFGYAGYVFNAETQLYVVRFRWYAPDLGRFLERDPAGYTDGMLLYIYGLNNPLIFVDPMGLFGLNPWTWGCAGKQWSQMMNRNAELTKRKIQEGVESGVIDERQARNDAFDLDSNLSMTELRVAGIELGAQVKVLEAGVNAAVEVALVPVGGAVFSAGKKGLQALRAADKAADVARAADGLSDAGRRLRVNQANSARAEAVTGRQFPGSDPQVTLKTTGGRRTIDTLSRGGRAIETKVGRQSLTKNARRQIARDIKLLRDPHSGVKSLQWNFYRSPITGRIGPTGPLRSTLQRHGIGIYHYPAAF